VRQFSRQYQTSRGSHEFIVDMARYVAPAI
jgi:hypothetical protein